MTSPWQRKACSGTWESSWLEKLLWVSLSPDASTLAFPTAGTSCFPCSVWSARIHALLLPNLHQTMPFVLIIFVFFFRLCDPEERLLERGIKERDIDHRAVVARMGMKMFPPVCPKLKGLWKRF